MKESDKQNLSLILKIIVAIISAISGVIGAFLYENSEVENADENAFALYRQAVDSECDEDIRSDAYYSLGLLYLDGRGTGLSPADALRCMEESAELGNAGAQFMAGKMYLEGAGAAVSEEKASRYLKMAAEQGDTRAEELLLSIS